MMDPHAIIGICLIIFYVPLMAASGYLFAHHARPSLPWRGALLFSLVRIGSGIVLILYEQKGNQDNVGMIIAADVLLGAGTTPLLLSLAGLLRVIQYFDFPSHKMFARFVWTILGLFTIGMFIGVAGGALEGQYQNANDVSTGIKLEKASYVLITVVIVTLIGAIIVLWSKKDKLSRTSMIILHAMTIIAPFVVLRLIYSLLAVWTPYTDQTWHPLFGSLAAEIVMQFIAEYIVIVLVTVTGFRIPRVVKRSRNHPSTLEDGSAVGKY